MKLRRLVLDDFYRGNPLELSFADPELGLQAGRPRISFMVGANGTGKSRVLARLGLIFSHLAIQERPGLGFELEYGVGNRDVLITTSAATADGLSDGTLPPTVAPGLWVFFRQEPGGWEVRDRWPSTPREWLPGRVLGYSTGPVSRLEWALAQSTERIVTERAAATAEPAPDVLGSAEQERYTAQQQRQFEAMRQRYLDNPVAVAVGAEDALLAALALLAHPGASRAPGDALRSQALARLELADHAPLAAFSLDVASEWRELVSGRAGEVLGDLLQAAERRVAVERDGGRRVRAVFVLGEDLDGALERIADSSLVLFEHLHAWWRRGALVQCHLVVGKQGLDDRLLDDDLSDGEFLFLGRYALLLLLSGVSDVLVLLDEPDTHFNDQWKVDLVHEISEILSVPQSPDVLAGEVLIATHSDLTLTDADRACVQVFRVIEEDDQRVLEVRHPSQSPFAADRSDIAADMFDGVAATGSYSRDRIDEAVALTDTAKLRRIVKGTGPGFHRFRLQLRLDELERDDAHQTE